MPAPPITIVIDGDAEGLSKELKGIQKDLASFATGATESSKKAGAAFDGLTKKIIKLTVAFFAVKKAMALFTKAMELAGNAEALRTQFDTLLGGADAAEERMKELVEFAATTPFDIPGVGKASKILETLTKGALSTGEGLRFVGDIAAFSGERFQDMAVHVGRLFSGLNSGRAVGESLGRLQELGLISAEARKQIEDLQKAGKAGDQVWKIAAEDLARFGGSMAKMSGTFQGKLSNLGDAWDQFLVKIGEPIIDAVGPVLERISGLLTDFQGSASGFGEFIARTVTTIETVIMNIVRIFKQGTFRDILVLSVGVAVERLILGFRQGLSGTITGLAAALPGIVQAAFQQVTDPAAWQAIGFTLKAIWHDMMAILIRAMKPLLVALGPKGTAENVEHTAKSEEAKAFSAAAGVTSALNRVDFAAGADAIIQAGVDFSKGFKEGTKNITKSAGLLNKEAALAGHLLQGNVMAGVDEAQKNAVEGAVPFVPKGGDNFDKAGKGKTVIGNLGAGDSLTSIGGGGNVGIGKPVTITQKQLEAAQKGNELLTEIVRNTKNSSGGLTVSTTGG